MTAQRQPSHDPVISLCQLLDYSELKLGRCIGTGNFSSVFGLKKVDLDDSENEMPNSDRLGRSSFAHQLYLTREMKGESVYVVKHLKSIESLSAAGIDIHQAARDIATEAQIMLAMSHPNILAIRALARKGTEGFRSGDLKNFFFVVDALEMTLDQHIHAYWRFTLDRFRFMRKTVPWRSRKYATKINHLHKERVAVARDVAKAIAYMHQRRLIHRDIKPANVGFDTEGNVKVFDFGLTRLVPRNGKGGKAFIMSMVGTPMYTAPEVAWNRAYTELADMFSFGVLLWEVLALSTPGTWRTDFAMNQPHTVIEEDVPICPCWSKSLQTLVRECVSISPQKRPTAEEVLSILRSDTLEVDANTPCSSDEIPQGSTFSTRPLKASIVANAG